MSQNIGARNLLFWLNIKTVSGTPLFRDIPIWWDCGKGLVRDISIWWDCGKGFSLYTDLSGPDLFAFLVCFWLQPNIRLSKHQIKLRTYPYQFGLRILRILGDLQKTGCKTYPQPPESFDPLKCYQEQQFTDLWEDAGMLDVLRYLYGNRHLRVPSEWKPHLLPIIP